MLQRLIRGLADIIYPRACIICKEPISKVSVDKLVCIKCWGSIKKNTPPFCHCCGRQIKIPGFAKNICATCLKQKLHFDRAFSPFVYTGVIKELIHEFKYNNKQYLGPILSKPMVNFINEYRLPLDFIDFIIPMPLYKTKLREREFNQAQVLSNYIAQEFNKLVLPTVLKRHRNTKTQTGLETTERFLNVKDSFSTQKDICLKGKNLLLIDDVLTTGATCSEATVALKKAGAQIVFVLTVAN